MNLCPLTCWSCPLYIMQTILYFIKLGKFWSVYAVHDFLTVKSALEWNMPELIHCHLSLFCSPTGSYAPHTAYYFLNKQTLIDKEDHNGSVRDNVVCCVSSPHFIAPELHTERACCFRGWRLNTRRRSACIYWKYSYFLKKKDENVNNLTFILNWIQNSSRYTYNLIFWYEVCLGYTDILILTYFESCIIALCKTAKWNQNIPQCIGSVSHLHWKTPRDA